MKERSVEETKAEMKTMLSNAGIQMPAFRDDNMWGWDAQLDRMNELFEAALAGVNPDDFRGHDGMDLDSWADRVKENIMRQFG